VAGGAVDPSVHVLVRLLRVPIQTSAMNILADVVYL
jgi:hypothetical protein